MLKKTIVYENPFTEQQVAEEHYFHISKADLVEMEMEEHTERYEKDGETFTGMRAKLQRIVDSNDGKAIMAEFKDIIRRSYGKKDGNRFLKSAAIWTEFEQTEAFSQLLFELCTDPGAAADFINGIIPGNLEQVAAEMQAKVAETNGAEVADEPVYEGPRDDPLTEPGKSFGIDVAEVRTLTEAEMVEMDPHELKAGLAAGRFKLS